MAEFTVRIELHGATAGDYEVLHKRMEAAGYARYMMGVNANGAAGRWQLPTAEYTCTSSASAEWVRNHARGIADTVRNGAWCLVTQVADRAIYSQMVA